VRRLGRGRRWRPPQGSSTWSSPLSSHASKRRWRALHNAPALREPIARLAKRNEVSDTDGAVDLDHKYIPAQRGVSYSEHQNKPGHGIFRDTMCNWRCPNHLYLAPHLASAQSPQSRPPLTVTHSAWATLNAEQRDLVSARFAVEVAEKGAVFVKLCKLAVRIWGLSCLPEVLLALLTEHSSPRSGAAAGWHSEPAGGSGPPGPPGRFACTG
jgi:hypothetical protein